MNTLTIPSCPNWYEANILACAPDNTLIYGARNDIVILENNSDPNDPANVRIITRAHTQKILSISLNKNWGQPKKLAVSVSEDKIINLWNVETGQKHAAHNKHLPDSKVVGATFAGEDRVISVSEEGTVVVWNLSLNETTVLKDIFGMKMSVSCISTCPHATWLTAFGLKSGLIIVADLRKNGRVLFKMRGHDKAVISLSWCPVPINIFPKNPLNYVGQKKNQEEVETKEQLQSIESDVKADLKSDSDAQESSHPLPKMEDSSVDNILQECKILNKILGNVKSDSDEQEASHLLPKVEDSIDVKADLKSDSDVQESSHPLPKMEDSSVDNILQECKILNNKILGNVKSDSDEQEASRLLPKVEDSIDVKADLKSDSDVQESSHPLPKMEDSSVDNILQECKTLNNKILGNVKSDSDEQEASHLLPKVDDSIDVKADLKSDSDVQESSHPLPKMEDSSVDNILQECKTLNNKILGNVKSDSDEQEASHLLSKVDDSIDDNFVKECEILKKKILANVKSDFDEQETSHSLLKIEDSSDDNFLRECAILQNRILGNVKLESDKQEGSHHLLKVEDSSENNFLKECEILKNKILAKLKPDRDAPETSQPLIKMDDSSDDDFLKECEALRNNILGISQKGNTERLTHDIGESSESEKLQQRDTSRLVENENKLLGKFAEIVGNTDTVVGDIKSDVGNSTQAKTESGTINIKVDKTENNKDNSETDTKCGIVSNDQTLIDDNVGKHQIIKKEPLNGTNQQQEIASGSIGHVSGGKNQDLKETKVEPKEIVAHITDPSNVTVKKENNEEVKVESKDANEQKKTRGNKEDVTDSKIQDTEEAKIKSDKEVARDVNEPSTVPDNIEKAVKTKDTVATEIIVVKKESTEDVTPSESSLVSSEVKENASEPEDKKTCASVGRNIKKVVSEEEEPRKELLLASSAKEGNIYIWRAGTDGRLQTFFTLPSKYGKNKYKSNSDKIWITLCWITPTILLSSSRHSELIAWTLPKPQDQSHMFSVVQKDHSSLLFSISAPIVLLNEYNWKEAPTANNVWTTSQDRLLLNTSMSKQRSNLACYPTLGGGVHCLESSPLDPNRLAIGTGDGFIKIWDLSRPHKKCIIMNNFYQKIQSKVSAIAWHPTNETVLAFGTFEGRVGYLDPNSKSKTPVLLPHHFRSEIYKLEWAPISGKKDKLGLYVVSEGRIAIFSINKSNQGPIEIDRPDDTFIYSLSWTPDYSLMAAVTKTGYVIVHSPNLKIICKHYFHYRLQNILWHPNASDSTSKQHNVFAAMANLKFVVVYKFDLESGNNDENIVNVYQSEANVILAMAWSPYEPTQLIIGSDMGFAQIWDSEKAEILATFINTNYEAVTSVIWSPVDLDYAITGGRDNTLKIWKISEHPPMDEKEISKNRKKALKETTAESTNLLPKAEEPSVPQFDETNKKKNSLLPKFYNPKTNGQIVAGLRRLFNWKENSENVEVNADENLPYDILNVFGSDSAMNSLVSENELVHKEKGKYKLNATLSLFRGDISTSIKEAIDEKRVTLHIISLAPMVSPKLWQLACETYANQLSECTDSDPLEIATYYLACHKVEKAVYSLCGALMFREALALAKCRMLGTEVVNGIIEKWAARATVEGNFEAAAQCYIFLGKYEEPATLLLKRTSLQVIEFVVELAEKSGNEELHKAALYKYNLHKSQADNETKEETELPTKQEAFLKRTGVTTAHTENDEESKKDVGNGHNPSGATDGTEVDTNTSSDDLKSTGIINCHGDGEIEKGETPPEHIKDDETDTKSQSDIKNDQISHNIEVATEKLKNGETDKTLQNDVLEIPANIVNQCETQIRNVIKIDNVISDIIEVAAKNCEIGIKPQDDEKIVEISVENGKKYETVKNESTASSSVAEAEKIETDLHN